MARHQCAFVAAVSAGRIGLGCLDVFDVAANLIHLLFEGVGAVACVADLVIDHCEVAADAEGVDLRGDVLDLRVDLGADAVEGSLPMTIWLIMFFIIISRALMLGSPSGGGGDGGGFITVGLEVHDWWKNKFSERRAVRHSGTSWSRK